MRLKGSVMTHDTSTALLEADGRADEGADSTPNVITACLVPEDRRMQFLPSKFGLVGMLRVEMSIYAWMQRLCPAYNGGHWNFIELSNDGGYMVPTGADTFDMSVDGNGFEGQVSADTAGLIATVFALNALIWQGLDKLNDKYEQLLEYIGHHPDRAVILRAID
ncbi:MAG: antirestriction protein [Burkholderiales bacterium]|nr:MAG: antirestriction protein [Burkholderiales bacterium]